MIFQMQLAKFRYLRSENIYFALIIAMVGLRTFSNHNLIPFDKVVISGSGNWN